MSYVSGESRSQIQCMYCLDDEISQDNIVRIIDLLIDKIVLDRPQVFREKVNPEVGRPSFAPADMIKLLIYGYMNRVNSSRRLAKECKRNIEVKWLLNNVQPKYRVIADFRKDNYDLIKEVTITFRLFLKEWELITGNRAAIDGTKIKANTKAHSLLSPEDLQEQIEQLNEEIEKYLQLLEINDQETVTSDDKDDDNDNHNNTSAINSLQRQIEQLQLEQERLTKLLERSESENNRKIPSTDPDAISMFKGRNSLIGYNVQFIVDSLHKLIMSTHVSNSSSDQKQMIPALDALERETGIVPGELIADNGYENVDAVQAIEKKGKTDVFIMVKRSKIKETGKKDKYKKKDFIYNKEKDIYICPEGKELKRVFKTPAYRKSRLAIMYRGNPDICNTCPHKSLCTTSKRGRYIYRYVDEEWAEEYWERMKAPYSKTLLKSRKGMIEHVFGTMKIWMGKMPLLLRSKEKVETEINIYATAYNLKRIINLFGFEKVREMIMGLKLPLLKIRYLFLVNLHYCFAYL